MGTQHLQGTVVILNGASSSGKTSIAKALQALFDTPFLDAGLDRFIWMLPKRYLDRPLWDDVLGLNTEAGLTGHRLVTAMHRAIVALSQAGSNVVADHVLVESDWVDDAAALFADLPAYLVGVRCPLEVLEQRERDRRDRTLGQARAQVTVVHKHVLSRGGYDVEVDSSVESPEACACRIADHVATARPEAFRRLLAASEPPPDSDAPPPMVCRVGCGACCIALSISSPIPGMPEGKPSGVRCVQLTPDNRCKLFGRPERPEVCVRLRPEPAMCGTSAEEALAYLYALEAATRPLRHRND